MHCINEMLTLSPGLTKPQTWREARNLQTHSRDAIKPKSIPASSVFMLSNNVYAFVPGCQHHILLILRLLQTAHISDWVGKQPTIHFMGGKITLCVSTDPAAADGLMQARVRFPSQSFRFFGEWRSKYFLAAPSTTKFKSWNMNEIMQTDSNYTTYCEKLEKKLFNFFIVLHFVYLQAFVASVLHTKTKPSGISLPTTSKLMEDLNSSVGSPLQSPKVQAVFAPLCL